MGLVSCIAHCFRSSRLARIDKYLHATRFFKTRSLAAQAVEKGRVLLNDGRVKPAKEVRVGDELCITIQDTTWVVEVLLLSEVRASAPIAQTLYAETEASKLARAAAAERKKLFTEPAADVAGRPTKRNRRDIGRVRGWDN